jgi:drug/metabolite transporter (DMT)-like permease
MLLGNPATILGNLTLKSLLSLLFDWRFLLGGVLALIARFIFVIINNLASKHEELASAHLTITAVATTASVVFVIAFNHFLLGDQLKLVQLIGIGIVLFGLFLVFR